MHHGKGFTLVELMVTIAVLGVITAFALPSFRNMVMGNRLVTQANDFTTALNYARSEAVKRGYKISLCRSTNRTSCSTSGTNWEAGWIIFMDRDTDGVVDTNDEILRVHEAFSGTSTLTSTTSSTLVQYSPTGFTFSSGATWTFRLCDNRTAEKGRQFVISSTGRVKVTEYQCS